MQSFSEKNDGTQIDLLLGIIEAKNCLDLPENPCSFYSYISQSAWYDSSQSFDREMGVQLHIVLSAW